MNDAVEISATSVHRPAGRSAATSSPVRHGGHSTTAGSVRLECMGPQNGRRSGRVFLLSPANCSGRRAKMVLADRAQFDVAVRLRSGDGAALGEVFAFVSGLYFKGKLAYALEFARPPEPGAGLVGSGALVITPTAGLRPAETAVTPDAIRGFAAVDIAANDPRYRRPPLARAT